MVPNGLVCKAQSRPISFVFERILGDHSQKTEFYGGQFHFLGFAVSLQPYTTHLSGITNLLSHIDDYQGLRFLCFYTSCCLLMMSQETRAHSFNCSVVGYNTLPYTINTLFYTIPTLSYAILILA